MPGIRHNAAVDISAKTDYAVRAMLALAQSEGSGTGPISVDALATAQDLPRKFLEAILSDLRRAGLVTSTRGARGGYVLSRPASQTRLGDLVGLPETERHSHYFFAQLPQQFDAVIHIDRTRAVQPLDAGAHWDAAREVPETYPSGK